MKKIVFIMACVVFSTTIISRVEAEPQKAVNIEENFANHDAIRNQENISEEELRDELKKIDEQISESMQRGDGVAIDKLEKQRRKIEKQLRKK